jgi:hypothetical protein
VTYRWRLVSSPDLPRRSVDEVEVVDSQATLDLLVNSESKTLEEIMAVTRTTNIYNPAVIADVSHHDTLLYRVTVRGATRADSL